MYTTLADAQTARLRQDDFLREATARHLATAARRTRVPRGARPGTIQPTPLHPAGFLRRAIDAVAGGLHAPSTR